jgi:hypothetical protein
VQVNVPHVWVQYVVQTGLLSAYIIKTLYFARHSTDREIAIMTLMAYLSYILAEVGFASNGILHFIWVAHGT